eukprot:1158700-Pelagomonas_calceolata.AAC.2
MPGLNGWLDWCAAVGRCCFACGANGARGYIVQVRQVYALFQHQPQHRHTHSATYEQMHACASLLVQSKARHYA